METLICAVRGAVGVPTESGNFLVQREGKLYIEREYKGELIDTEQLTTLPFDKYHTLQIYGNVDDDLLPLLRRQFPIVRHNDKIDELCHSSGISLSLKEVCWEHPSTREALFHLRDALLSIGSYEVTLKSIPSCYFSPIILEGFGSSETLRLTFSMEPVELYMIGGKLIEPAFTALFLKHCIEPIRPPPSQPIQSQQSAPSQATLLDSSITLTSWTPTPSTHPIDHKASNKNNLKKLMLLSLRHVGVDKNHGEFPSIWKHLYCGCLFALRRELGREHIEQAAMLAVIRSNMNFLNIT